jgi:hypothetical protein
MRTPRWDGVSSWPSWRSGDAASMQPRVCRCDREALPDYGPGRGTAERTSFSGVPPRNRVGGPRSGLLADDIGKRPAHYRAAGVAGSARSLGAWGDRRNISLNLMARRRPAEHLILVFMKNRIYWKKILLWQGAQAPRKPALNS